MGGKKHHRDPDLNIVNDPLTESGEQAEEIPVINDEIVEQGGKLPDTTDSEVSEEQSDETPQLDEVYLANNDELIDVLNQEIESLKQKSIENQDKAIRAQAELDNVRKRVSRDVENAHKYALEKFINDLLPVIDSLELGKSAAEDAGEMESVREGMDLTLKMFSDTLERYGIKVINPEGEKFNPEQHEAVSIQELDDTKSGCVISVMQKGYELNGRLIRPAMVIVAK